MKHRCEQCGREGTREFTTVGGFWRKIDPRDNEPAWIPFVTVCANKNACQKRWPRPTDDHLDRLYA